MLSNKSEWENNYEKSFRPTKTKSTIVIKKDMGERIIKKDMSERKSLIDDATVASRLKFQMDV